MRRGEWPRPCVGCGRSVRPHAATAGEFPGTMAIISRGLCSGCYRREWRAGTLDSFPAGDRGYDRPPEIERDTTARDAWNARMLAAYINARRERGLPDDGTLARCGPLEGLI